MVGGQSRYPRGVLDRRHGLIAIGFFLVACGPGAGAASGASTAGGDASDVASNQNAPPPQPEAAQPAAATATPSAAGPGGSVPGQRRGSGQSREDPVICCGPVDSYTYVAAEFRCPDGQNPLGGDPSAGQRARVGNVGPNASGHIIDLYRVPCGGGEVDIFVDMYGCPEMEQMF